MEGGKRSLWMSHVKKTMKANKGKTLMEVLKMAKKTYKKKGMRGGADKVPGVTDMSKTDMSSDPKPAPTMGGRRRKTRKNKKSRKGGVYGY